MSAHRFDGIAIDLLGAFEVRHAGRRIELPPSAQRLIAFLALAGRPLRRLHVAGKLWTDASEARANAALRTALWRIRCPDDGVVADYGHCLAIAAAADIDAHRTAALARRALADPAGSVLHEPELPRLWTSEDLLPDWYEDWVLIERERHRQLCLHALEAVCAALVDAGRFGDAAEAALAAIARDPLRESAHRAMIAVHIAEGNVAEALRQYDRFRAALWDELRLEPSPRMTVLMACLRRPSAAASRTPNLDTIAL